MARNGLALDSLLDGGSVMQRRVLKDVTPVPHNVYWEPSPLVPQAADVRETRARQIYQMERLNPANAGAAEEIHQGRQNLRSNQTYRRLNDDVLEFKFDDDMLFLDPHTTTIDFGFNLTFENVAPGNTASRPPWASVRAIASTTYDPPNSLGAGNTSYIHPWDPSNLVESADPRTDSLFEASREWRRALRTIGSGLSFFQSATLIGRDGVTLQRIDNLHRWDAIQGLSAYDASWAGGPMEQVMGAPNPTSTSLFTDRRIAPYGGETFVEQTTDEWLSLRGNETMFKFVGNGALEARYSIPLARILSIFDTGSLLAPHIFAGARLILEPLANIAEGLDYAPECVDPITELTAGTLFGPMNYNITNGNPGDINGIIDQPGQPSLGQGNRYPDASLFNVYQQVLSRISIGQDAVMKVCGYQPAQEVVNAITQKYERDGIVLAFDDVSHQKSQLYAPNVTSAHFQLKQSFQSARGVILEVSDESITAMVGNPQPRDNQGNVLVANLQQGDMLTRKLIQIWEQLRTPFYGVRQGTLVDQVLAPSAQYLDGINAPPREEWGVVSARLRHGNQNYPSAGFFTNWREALVEWARTFRVSASGKRQLARSRLGRAFSRMRAFAVDLTRDAGASINPMVTFGTTTRGVPIDYSNPVDVEITVRDPTGTTFQNAPWALNAYVMHSTLLIAKPTGNEVHI